MSTILRRIGELLHIRMRQERSMEDMSTMDHMSDMGQMADMAKKKRKADDMGAMSAEKGMDDMQHKM